MLCWCAPRATGRSPWLVGSVGGREAGQREEQNEGLVHRHAGHPRFSEMEEKGLYEKAKAICTGQTEPAVPEENRHIRERDGFAPGEVMLHCRM